MPTIHIAQPDDGFAHLARTLERDPDAPASLFVVAYDDGPVGMIRVIDAGKGIWTLGAFAYADAAGGRALLAAFAREGVRQGITSAVAQLEVGYLDRLTATFGPVFVPRRWQRVVAGKQAVEVRLRQVPTILASKPPLHDRSVPGTGFVRPVSAPGRRALAPAFR